jgi:hypothetical protein
VSRPLKTLLGGLVALLAAGAAGCGGSGSTSAPPPPSEVPQALPKLPSGWHGRRDRTIGYAIGIPPGWRVDQSRNSTLIRSPDHLVAVTLSVDRNPDALELPLDEFATRALTALPGFKAPLEPGRPRPFGGTPLDAVESVATGTAESTGVQERVTLVVLRREGIVNYTIAIVENAKRGPSAQDRALPLRMVRTLRDQPVEARSSPESR